MPKPSLLAEEAEDRIGAIADRAEMLARGVALGATATGGFAYLIGMLVLPGSWRWVWLFAGVLVAAPPGVAGWFAVARLRATKRSLDEVAEELNGAVNDKAVRIALLDLANLDDDTANRPADAPLIKLGKQFIPLRDALEPHRESRPTAWRAVHAVTTMPGLVALGTVGSFLLLGGSAVAVLIRLVLLKR